VLVVLDVNILISALIRPAGVAGRVVLAGIVGRYDFAVCPRLLTELEATAARPRIASLLPVGMAERFLVDVQGAATIEPDPVVVSVSRDPKDDYLVALAGAIDADHLVTGDADLLDIVEPPVTITTLRTFADSLGL
jgi:uncharacterized protein